jgi:hypothetical protein
MNSNMRASEKFAYESFRGFVAIAVSLLLLPYGQQGLFAQDPQQQPQQDPQQYPQQQPPPQGNYMPLGAEQLNQLIAPIALYPDALVAQVLTAATYPQQVADANAWMGQYGGMPPDQRAAAANSMPWDPSIKSLTGFPDVLANLARNQNWTGALGNAYYNQPGDVMNAVQAMRFRAQQTGNLRPTPQYRVYPNDGLIIIEPVNPGLIYVPYYNPWAVYGISPWGGYYYMPPPRGVMFAAGLGIGFAAGISIGLFAHYGWGYNAWSPNWHGGVVVYNHTTYISRSTTVINRGNFGANNRGVFERPGAGVPNNFRPAVTSQSAAFHSQPGAFRGSGYANPRAGTPTAPQGAQGRQFGQPRPAGQASPYAQPRTPSQPGAYGQPRPQATQPAPYRPPTGQTAQPNRPTGQTNQPNRPTGNTPRPEMTRPQSNTPQNNTAHQPAPHTGGAPAPRTESTHGAQSSPPAHQQSGGKTPPKRTEEKR